MEKKWRAVGSVSGSMTSGIEDVLSSGRCVSSWVFEPASTVLLRSIISVFSPMNVAQDKGYKVLHTTYLPHLPSLHTKTSITVMWTNVSVQQSPYWTPNHFVLLDTAPSSHQRRQVSRLTQRRHVVNRRQVSRLTQSRHVIYRRQVS